MDEVDPLRTMQFARLPDDPCKKECAGGRKSEPSGQRKVSEPIDRRLRFSACGKPSIDRLHSKDRVRTPALASQSKRLGDEATGGIILIGRVKRRESQDVEGTLFVAPRRMGHMHRFCPHFTSAAAISR